MQFAYYRRQAKRDILPRLGFQAQLYYLATTSIGSRYGALYGARLTGYLPSFRQNDGLMLRIGWQKQSVANRRAYIPKKVYDPARGYTYNAQTDEMLTLSADYPFTWVMPDWSIGKLVYLRRLRSNLFYDYAHIRTFYTQSKFNLHSVGIDLIGDCNIIQTEFPVSIGVRTVFPMAGDVRSPQFQMLFTTSF
jgi:hypothetical protein